MTTQLPSKEQVLKSWNLSLPTHISLHAPSISVKNARKRLNCMRHFAGCNAGAQHLKCWQQLTHSFGLG
jgi:hypothetical protein